MKKLFLFAAVAVFGMSTMMAQGDVTIGATAGYVNGAAKVKVGSESASNSESGFFGGLTVNVPVSDKLAVQPEVLYTSVDETAFLQVPIMLQYMITDDLYAQGGPQINYILEDINTDDFTKLGIAVGVGAGYHITEAISANIKYALQVNNSFTGEGDLKSTFDFLSIGVGYRFN